MSKIVLNANNVDVEIAEVICQSCVGTLQKIGLKPTGLFSLRKYVRWVFKCNACPFQSKINCTRIKEQPIKK